MRAVVVDGVGQSGLRDLSVPEASPSGVLVRVSFVGICGSDLHYYHEGANGSFVVKEPLTLGHEISGTVSHDDSGEWAVGSRVVIDPAVYGPPEPDVCAPELWRGGRFLGSASTIPHTQGGMADYVVVEPGQLVSVPESLTLRSAALAEPLSVALHAVDHAGEMARASTLVVGAGTVGLLIAVAARERGATDITLCDVSQGAMRRARELGFPTVDSATGEVPQDRFPVVYEATGSPAGVDVALASVLRAGRVVQVGMFSSPQVSISYSAVVAKQLTLVGSFRSRGQITEAVKILAARPELGAIATHVLPLEDFATAFGLAGDPEDSGKVLLQACDDV